MTIASDLLQRHIQTLIEDNAQEWQTLIADDNFVGTCPCACHRPSSTALGARGGRLSRNLVPGGRGYFRFFDLKVYGFADPEGAVAEVSAEGLIKATGRIYRQDYVVFLRAAGGKIACLREYFDPVRAAKALNTAILGFES
jgi:uncharacterized protein